LLNGFRDDSFLRRAGGAGNEKAHRLGRNAGGFLTGGFRKGGGYLAQLTIKRT